MRRIAIRTLFAISSLFLAVTPANAEYVFKHEELPDALINIVYLLGHNPLYVHDQMAKGDPVRGDEDIRNIFAKLVGQFRALDHGLSTWIGFTGSFCKIQSQSPGYFCGDDGERISSPSATALLYVTTPIAAANNDIILILSGTSPEGTAIVAFPENGPPRVLYDYADQYIDSNICVLEKDMSPLRSIYQMRVTGPGIFTMRESGNIPSHEGEERITLVLSGDKCTLSTETIVDWILK